KAAALLPFLPSFDQFVLLHSRPRTEMVAIVDAMAPDDRMRLLDELPERSFEQLVRELSAPQREITTRCSAYPADCAARYMTPDFIAVFPNMRAEEALPEVRVRGRAKETVNLVYVLDSEGKLVDEVSLAALVMAKPGELVTQINDSPLIFLLDTDSLEN